MVGSYENSIFSFLKSRHTVFIVIAVIYIPTNSVEAFFFPTSSPAFVVCFLDDYYCGWGETESQGRFDLHFLYG
jgi:hypothetical protein